MFIAQVDVAMTIKKKRYIVHKGIQKQLEGKSSAQQHRIQTRSLLRSSSLLASVASGQNRTEPDRRIKSENQLPVFA